MPKTKRLTPEELENLFDQYREWTAENPIMLVKESYGKLLNVPHHRPMTLKGLFAYAIEHHGVDVHHYFNNSREAYNDYTGLCKNIKVQIHAELTNLALVGAVKENLAAKILGLKEDINVTGTGINAPEVIFVTTHRGNEQLNQ